MNSTDGNLETGNQAYIREKPSSTIETVKYSEKSINTPRKNTPATKCCCDLFRLKFAAILIGVLELLFFFYQVKF